jgi:dolichol-phosphate mannosyltransferase
MAVSPNNVVQLLDLAMPDTTENADKPIVCFVLPTYNEEAHIGQTIDAIFANQDKCPGHAFRILVVDDNSSDSTQAIVIQRSAESSLLTMITGNKVGLGDAYKRGFSHALEKFNPDYLFQMDSDGQHNPDVIPEFLNQVDQGYSLVIGSRFVAGGATPEFSLRRKLISKVGNLLVRYVGGVRHVNDCTSGYRCISASYLQRCNLGFLATKGYSFQSSLLCELVLLGAKVKEIPIVFVSRKGGDSKLSWNDQWEFLINIPKLGFHSHADFIRYSIVGFSGVAINLGGYWFLTRHLGMSVETAPLLSIEASLISNFILNHIWTFKDRPSQTAVMMRFLRFHSVAGIAGLANYILFYVAYKYFMFNDLAANLLGIISASLINYLINSNWTWKKS